MELCCSVIETYGAHLLDHENEHIVKAYVHQTQDDEAARKEARKYLDGHDIGCCPECPSKERTLIIMTEKNAEMARLLMGSEAVVEELDRQGLLEAVINLGFDPDQMAMAVIKAADRDVVPAKRSPPL